MSMQIKRGTTAGWALGVEQVKFDKLSVNGSDSTKHCEGTSATILLGTSSASDFTNSGSKALGRWLIAPLELPLGCWYRIKISVSSPLDALSPAQLIFIHTSTAGNARVSLTGYNSPYLTDPNTRSVPLTFSLDHSSEHNYEGYFEVGAGDHVACYVTWPTELSEPEECTINVSIRQAYVEGGANASPNNCYERLLPGQLGAEYLAGGGTALKVGPEQPDGSSWNNIPYIGQVLPTAMYGDTLPSSGIPGQLFFLKA